MTTFRNRVKEYRLVIPGKAESFRSMKAADYKSRICAIARNVFGSQPTELQVDVIIDYFHSTPRRMDMDNISKCVMDALNGLAYLDDKQVRYQTSGAHDLTIPIELERGPADLIKPLRKHSEYTFVRVREIEKSNIYFI